MGTGKGKQDGREEGGGGGARRATRTEPGVAEGCQEVPLALRRDSERRQEPARFRLRTATWIIACHWDK